MRLEFIAANLTNTHQLPGWDTLSAAKKEKVRVILKDMIGERLVEDTRDRDRSDDEADAVYDMSGDSRV